MVNTEASERRKQVSLLTNGIGKVLLGDLPNDFLRLGSPSTSQDEQVALDEQAARALQHQLNAPALQQGAPMYAQAQGFYGAGFVPPNTRGRLSVTVLTCPRMFEAKLAKNYGLVRMDPYCRLRVGNTVFETPTDVSGGKSPKWNRTVHCYLPEGIDTVFLELFDERAFTTDERVAWAHIPIPEAVFSNETIEDWYQLSGQQGEAKEGMIQMTFSFAPVDAPPVNYIPVQQPPLMIIPGAQPIPVQQQQQPAQPPAPQGPLYTENDVKELQEMFPNVEADVIVSVLEEKRGNKDAAVNALLSMTAD